MRRRQTATLFQESQVLARGAAHVLDVLKARHPKLDEARLALRGVLELEAALTEAAGRLTASAPRRDTTGSDHADSHDAGRS